MSKPEATLAKREDRRKRTGGRNLERNQVLGLALFLLLFVENFYYKKNDTK